MGKSQKSILVPITYYATRSCLISGQRLHPILLLERWVEQIVTGP